MTTISRDLIERENDAARVNLKTDYEALGERLARTGVDIKTVTDQIAAFGVAIPSWGVGTGGTRFARFPGPGEPRSIFDKLDDCSVINRLTAATPSVSLHIPWDTASAEDLQSKAQEHSLRFDAMNSNTFQDQNQQTCSYKFGSLSHTDAATRQQAIEHNLACIELGEAIGSQALTVWVGDGSNFPGQSNFTAQFERYLDSAQAIYNSLPDDWRLYTEHKIYEPAFYSTVVQDWGTNYLIATSLGERAYCLVDLGHHAPNVNIEMIVARLVQFQKLGGFHFNDSKYGDDDLDSAAIDPFRLFLVFNELVDADVRGTLDQNLAHMLDQSHNVTDPIESLMQSAMEVQRAYAQALLVDRAALADFQEANDALMAAQVLKAAFRTDVEPILAMARLQKGAAVNPIAAYRKSGYRQEVTEQRPEVAAGASGIV